MTSSIKPSVVGAAMTVLVLAATLNVALPASLPPTLSSSRNETTTGFWVPFSIETRNFQHSEQPSKTPDALPSSKQDTNYNSSLVARLYNFVFGSSASLYEDVTVFSSGDGSDWVIGSNASQHEDATVSPSGDDFDRVTGSNASQYEDATVSPSGDDFDRVIGSNASQYEDATVSPSGDDFDRVTGSNASQYEDATVSPSGDDFDRVIGSNALQHEDATVSPSGDDFDRVTGSNASQYEDATVSPSGDDFDRVIGSNASQHEVATVSPSGDDFDRVTGSNASQYEDATVSPSGDDFYRVTGSNASQYEDATVSPSGDDFDRVTGSNASQYEDATVSPSGDDFDRVIGSNASQHEDATVSPSGDDFDRVTGSNASQYEDATVSPSGNDFDRVTGSNASKHEDATVSTFGDGFDRIAFLHEDIIKQQEPRTPISRQRRSLAKLDELYCGAEAYPLVTISEGTYVQIMSPGYPRGYSNNARCGWRFTTEPDRVLRVICPIFQLGRGDFTMLKDYTNSPNLRFTDSTVMKNVTTTSHKLFLGFKSDVEVEGQGFLCVVRSLAMALPVKTERPVEKVTKLTDMEVPDFKKRSSNIKRVLANTTITGNIATEESTATALNKMPVTLVPTLSSESLLSSSTASPSTHTKITGDYLRALKQEAIRNGLDLTLYPTGYTQTGKSNRDVTVTRV